MDPPNSHHTLWGFPIGLASLDIEGLLSSWVLIFVILYYIYDSLPFLFCPFPNEQRNQAPISAFLLAFISQSVIMGVDLVSKMGEVSLNSTPGYAKTPFGKEMLKHFMISPSYKNLNHGASYRLFFS